MHNVGYLCLGRAIDDYQSASDPRYITSEIIQTSEQEAEPFPRN